MGGVSTGVAKSIGEITTRGTTSTYTKPLQSISQDVEQTLEKNVPLIPICGVGPLLNI